jgi:hypothetical protein
MKLGRAPQAKPFANLPSHEPRSAIECPGGVLLGRPIAKARVEHARMLKVRADLHARHRDKPDTGVMQFASDHRRHFSANLVGDTIGSGSLAHE